MVLGLTGIVVGYVGAIALAKPLGALISRASGLPPLLTVPLGGLAGFMLVSIIHRIVTWRVERRRAAAIKAGEVHSPLDKGIGAGLGAVAAAALVVMIAWAAMTLQRFAANMPRVDRSVTGRASGRIVARVLDFGARRAVGDPFVAGVLSRVMANPARGGAALRTAMQNPDFQRLMTDADVRHAITTGDAAVLSRHASFGALAADTAFTSAADELGLSDAGTDPDRLAADLTTHMRPLLRSVETLRASDQFKQMLDDPALRRRLEAGDPQAILMDPRFGRLSAEFLRVLREEGRRR